MINDANDILGNKLDQSSSKKLSHSFNKNDADKKVCFYIIFIIFILKFFFSQLKSLILSDQMVCIASYLIF